MNVYSNSIYGSKTPTNLATVAAYCKHPTIAAPPAMRPTRDFSFFGEATSLGVLSSLSIFFGGCAIVLPLSADDVFGVAFPFRELTCFVCLVVGEGCLTKGSEKAATPVDAAATNNGAANEFEFS